MIKLSKLSVAMMLAVSGLSAAAQTQGTPGNLQSAVERAILQNPEVKLRFHNLEAAKSERDVGKAGWLPRVDMEVAGGGYQTKNPALSSNLGYSGSRASLQLRQTLFDGFATMHETRRLSYAQQTAYFDLLSASNQTALETVRAYVDVLRFRELVQLAADNFTTHQEVQDRLRQKTAAGVGRGVDLEQASGRTALAESNWLTEVSNLHDVSARYQRLVGDVPARQLATVDATTLPPQDQGVALADAVRKNPEFLSAVATLRGFKADADLRRAGYSPTLELRARQSLEANRGGGSGSYRDSTVELVLNYNLYRGGADKARVNQYVAKLATAYDLRDKACRDIWQTGLIAQNDSQRLSSQIQFLAQHELSTSKAKQVYQQQFDIGQRSLLDLLDTENELYQARRALANAEYDLKLSAARKLAAGGELLDALKLRPLSTDMPETPTNADMEDEVLLCSVQQATMPTLDRAFSSRPPSLPVEPVRPLNRVVAAVAAPAAEASCKELPKVVSDWLAAWNGKDLTRYLATYSSNFVPANGMNRSKWEAMRKTRIGKQGDLTVSIGALEPLRCDAKTAEVSFPQQYGSVDYSDKVEKTLSLEKVQGVWKITKETVTKGRTY